MTKETPHTDETAPSLAHSTLPTEHTSVSPETSAPKTFSWRPGALWGGLLLLFAATNTLAFYASRGGPSVWMTLVFLALAAGGIWLFSLGQGHHTIMQPIGCLGVLLCIALFFSASWFPKSFAIPLHYNLLALLALSLVSLAGLR